MLIIFVALDNSGQGLGFKISVEFINIFFYGLVVYFNLYYLIPNYLFKEKKFLHYCVFLILSVIIITPIKMVILYFFFSYFPTVQAQLIGDQYWYFLTSFLVVGASTIFSIVADWVRHQRERRDLQTQTMQSELKFLKSQINPHFLFNTLNNLYALTLKKSDKAPEIVIKLSEMMRYMLYECNEKRVLLSKEVNYLRNYLDLERLRQGKTVEINFDVVGEIKEQRVSPLLFIPFLENSFKHGLNHQIATGFVNIVLQADEKKVSFYIENSKPQSMPVLDRRRSGGIGLVNVRRRLNILYPNRYQLEINDHPNIYAVDLKIQLDS